MNMNKFNLSAVMLKRGMSCGDVCKAVGMSKAAFTIVHGGGSCSPERAEKIAAALNVPLSVLTAQKDIFDI